ncbi:MAG: prolipoprotein diacylglyceryl transferase [Acidimicrobiia bacterium]|nr:prolipoprotein diacylglyceryl transferase [Acidimicrobiia bacterium]
MEFSLLGAAAVAVFAFWAMLRWEAKRGNAAGCAVDLWDAALVSAAGGLLVGRLVAMTQAGINPITDPGQILLVRSGVSTPAAAIATLVIFTFVARRDLVTAADAIAPAALAGLAGWHAGCIVTGSCLGTESSLPWARALEGSDVTRHPVELYTAVGMAAAAILLALWKAHGRPPPGSVAGTALFAAGAMRLVTEPMRVSLGGGPVWLYGAAMIAGAAITVGSVVRRRRSVRR